MNESSPLTNPSSFFVRSGVVPEGPAPVVEAKADAKEVEQADVSDFIQPGEKPLGKLMDIENVADRMGLTPTLDSIDAYIRQEMDARSLTPTRSSYQQVFQELRSGLGIEHNMAFDKALEKMDTYIQMVREAQRITLMKERIHAHAIRL